MNEAEHQQARLTLRVPAGPPRTCLTLRIPPRAYEICLLCRSDFVVPLSILNINENEEPLAMRCRRCRKSEKCSRCCKIKKRKDHRLLYSTEIGGKHMQYRLICDGQLHATRIPAKRAYLLSAVHIILSRGMEEDTSHPISFLGERLDDELPILLAASPHRSCSTDKELMESTMSFICPLRSDAKGSRVARVLISGPLVGHKCADLGCAS
jgi:hypothetical protein